MKRVLPRLAGLFLMLVMVVAAARPALADPHATFFTAVGQQQLFFNLLAALDQADYVEPSGGNPCVAQGGGGGQQQQPPQGSAPTSLTPSSREVAGISSSGPLAQAQGPTAPSDQGGNQEGPGASAPCDPVFTRKDVLDRRTAAGFEAQTNPLARATTTGLAGTVTRLITPEGQDFWTSYLLHQVATEQERRTHFNDLLNKLCNEGLGGCSGPKAPGDVFVTDTTEATNNVARSAYLALQSDYDPNSVSQQSQLTELMKQAAGNEALKIPFDVGIANFKNSIQDPQMQFIFQQSLTRAYDKAMGVIPPPRFTSFTGNQGGGLLGDASASSLSAVQFDSSGEVEFEDDFTESFGSTFTFLSDALSFPVRMKEWADRYATKAAFEVEATTGSSGEKAEAIVIPTSDGRSLTGLNSRITVPAYNGPAGLYSSYGGLAYAEATRNFAALDVSGPEVSVTGETGIIIKSERSDPSCYSPGSPLRVHFTIENKTDRNLAGNLYVLKDGAAELDASNFNPSDRVESDKGHIKWSAIRLKIGEKTSFRFTDGDTNSDALKYRVTYSYNDSDTGRSTQGKGNKKDVIRKELDKIFSCLDLQNLPAPSAAGSTATRVAGARTEGAVLAAQDQDSEDEDKGADELTLKPFKAVTSDLPAARALFNRTESQSLLDRAY